MSQNQSFQALKKSGKQQLSQLADTLDAMSKPSYKEDEGYWKCQTDKVGNGHAIIRFLPASKGEDIPFVRYWSHGFKNVGTGRWYIEKSRTTLNDKDPVSEYNSQLWNTGTKENQDIVRNQKRNLNYVSNVYVVKDPAHPENEGKVFKFRYGKKIFDKLNGMMYPEKDELSDEVKEPVNPFDLWTGANFRLKIRKVDGFTNYDSSEFEKPGPLLPDDDALQKVWESQAPLLPIVAPDQFKSYEELKTKLYQVLGLTTTAAAAGEPAPIAPQAQPAAVKSPAKPVEGPKPAAGEPAEDESMAMFKRLAQGLDE